MRILASLPAKGFTLRIAAVSLTVVFAGLSLPAMAQTTSPDATPSNASPPPRTKPAKPVAKVDKKPGKTKTTAAKGGSRKASAIESAAEPAADALPPEIGSAIDTVRGWFNR